MRDLLYKELLDKGLVPINDLSGNPESVVVYLRNKTTGNIRGQITTPGLPANKDLSKPKDPETGATYVLANQNPSLKIYPRGQVLTENQAAFCLSKGLILSEGEFFKLDAVAHEAALSFITNPNNRLHQTDYDLTVVDGVATFKFDIGITGARYTVLGLRGLNYQLIDMNSRIDETSIMLRHNTSLSWTLFQLKNLLVYQENGEAVLPVFVKWSITGPEDADVIPAVGNEISNGLRMAVAGDKVVYGLDWDGYNKDITYRDGEVSVTLVNGCVGATASFVATTDLDNRTIEVSVNEGVWVDLYAAPELNVLLYPAGHAGASLMIYLAEGITSAIVKMRCSSDIGLYVNTSQGFDEVHQQNQAYTLYNVNGAIVDPSLEVNKEYSSPMADDTSTEEDYVVRFRSVHFCLVAA